MDNDAVRKKVVGYIRACLISSRERTLSLRELERTYKDLVFTIIPYHQLGFNTLLDFLQSEKTLQLRKASDGQTFVMASENPLSVHISDMIARDKTKKKKKKSPYRSSYPSHPPHNPQRWRPPYQAAQPQGYLGFPTRIPQHRQFLTSSPKREPSLTKHTSQGPENGRNFNNNIRSMERMQLSPQQQKPMLSEKENNKPILPPALLRQASSEKTNLTKIMERAKDRLSDPPLLHNASVRDSDQNEFVESGDICKDLWNFTRFHHLGEPMTMVQQMKSKPNRKVEYYCKIKIDNMAFSSYPQEYYDEKSAAIHASKIALQALLKKHGKTRHQTLNVSSFGHIEQRVPGLVAKHFNGIWSWQVEDDYKDLYNEALPSNWLEVVNNSPIITVEKFADKYVLRACLPENGLQKGKPQSVLDCDVSIPTSRATFDDTGLMTAIVTCPVSAAEVWCRQTGTTEAAEFDAMIENLNTYYQELHNKSTSMPLDRFVKGHYYAAWDQTWHRAQILELREGGVLCLFVDRGDDSFVPFDSIYPLHREYCRERMQAFVCRLAGLEDLFQISQLSDVIQELEGADVTLELVDGDSTEEAQKVFNVVMYNIDTGVAYNKEIMLPLAMENASPKFELEESFEVCVSNITNKGYVYVQTCTAGHKFFMKQLEELEEYLPAYLATNRQREIITRENSKDKLYFAKLEDDSRYYRVRIIDSPPNFQYAQVLYVDVGKTRIIKLTDVTLLSLNLLSPALARFIPQATLVRLHFRRTPEDLASKLRDLIPLEASVLLRVQGRDENDLPTVMLFVPQQSGLVSVNDSLSFGNFSRETQISPPGRITPPDSPHNVPSTGILQSPRLPKTSEFYEVIVPLAVNPWNFVVQPLETTNNLTELMNRLQATFANRHVDHVNLKDIKAGNIYAAKREETGEWHRVCVLKTIYPAIVVYFVDYGHYANLGYQNLFALDKHFLDLPHQAIKAKLAGIKPVQEKWSVGDCRYFEHLVQKCKYVSVIIAVEKDELYPCDNVLVLKLIDTTLKQDVLIGDLLIQKKIAIKN